MSKREALQRLAVLGLVPLSVAVTLALVHHDAGSPLLVVGAFYGVVLMDGVALWIVVRRWRRRLPAD